MPADWRWPDTTHRVTICGRTGSGKSVFAAWLLSRIFDPDGDPWVIIDYKGDDLLASLGAVPWDVSSGPPRKSGLYYMRPHPHEPDEMENFLWKTWARGHVGLYIDEGYMIPERKGRRGTGGPFKTLLTQGRSKRIPVITLSQRPVDLNGHVFSEADFFGILHLARGVDRERVGDYAPIHSSRRRDDVDGVRHIDYIVPRHHVAWYDVARDWHCLLAPCPGPDAIRQKFAELQRRRKYRAI